MKSKAKKLLFTFRTCQVNEENGVLLVRLPVAGLAWWACKGTKWNKVGKFAAGPDGLVHVSCEGNAVAPKTKTDAWHTFPTEAQWLDKDVVAFRFEGGAKYWRRPFGPGQCLQVEGRVAGVSIGQNDGPAPECGRAEEIWVEAKERLAARVAVAPRADPDDQPHQPG